MFPFHPYCCISVSPGENRKMFSLENRKMFPFHHYCCMSVSRCENRKKFPLENRKMFLFHPFCCISVSPIEDRKMFFCGKQKNVSFASLYTKVITRTISIFKGFKTDVSNLNQKKIFLAFGNLNNLRKIRLKIFSDEQYIAYLKKG